MQGTSQETIAGRYRVEGEIARGGMGSVLLAEDLLLHRKVAVKRLHPHLTADPNAGSRFRQEALSAASLGHPGVVTVFDAGEDDQGAYLVMELVEGETLAERLAAIGAFPPEEAARIGAQVARGLEHAHDRGIVHRDVKPGNVMLMPDGRAKIGDFGIAKTLDGSGSHTTTGSVMGTAAYLSPEQVTGLPATPASDLYALGLVLYEMVAGHKAFTGDSAVQVALAQQTQEPPPLPASVPAPLQAVILRALSKDPAERFATTGEMAEALEAIASGIEPAPAVAAAADPTESLSPVETGVLVGPMRTWFSSRWILAAVLTFLGMAVLFVWLLAFAPRRTPPPVSPAPRLSRVSPSPSPSISANVVPPPTTVTIAPTTPPPPTTTPPPITTPPPVTTPPPTTPPPTSAPPSPTALPA